MVMGADMQRTSLLPPLLLLLAAATAGSVRIISTTPVDGTIVKEGRSIRLSCRTDVR